MRALICGPEIVRSWLDRQGAEAGEARARTEALRAEAEERREDGEYRVRHGGELLGEDLRHGQVS
jgi:hypothetical protein